MIFRFGLFVAILTLLFWFDIIGLSALRIAASDPALTAGVIALVVAGAQPVVLRWYILLRSHGSPVAIRPVWTISYISWFAGSFLPGAAGADAIRAVLISRQSPSAAVPAVLSILTDRLLGLISLLLFVLILAALSPSTVMEHPAIVGVVALTASGVVAFLAMLPMMAWLSRVALPILRPWPRIASLVTDVSAAAASLLTDLRMQPGTVLACVALGLVNHALTVLAIVLLAHGVGISNIGDVQLAMAGALAILANHVPLTPGGLGIGEASFAELCRLLSPDAGGAEYGSVILILRILGVLAMLPGAFALTMYGRDAIPGRS